MLNGNLFIHIPRTAGTSIRDAMLATGKAWYAAPVSRPNQHIRDRANQFSPHLTLDQLAKPLGNLGSLWKFTVARNPWDRFVSVWHYFGAKGSFQTFMKRFLRRGRSISQSKFFDGSQKFDCVMRYEALERDWLWVRDQLMLYGAELPRANPGHNRRKHREYRDFYTDALAAEVEELEAVVVDMFGYEF